ncbi:MAG: hypothetical protein JWR18_3024 [Segetibacter sp.]|jgi:hypothetical protein|nr:hypothetical protein [Segetibacter sp.]
MNKSKGYLFAILKVKAAENNLPCSYEELIKTETIMEYHAD